MRAYVSGSDASAFAFHELYGCLNKACRTCVLFPMLMVVQYKQSHILAKDSEHWKVHSQSQVLIYVVLTTRGILEQVHSFVRGQTETEVAASD